MDITNFELKVDDLSVEILKLMDVDSINQIAKETNFTKRSGSKLDGFKFLDMILFTHFNHKELSLNDMSTQLFKRYGLHITKQSIDNRFTEQAVNFFKKILEKALKIKLKNAINIDFTTYNRFRIKDATSFQLPELMKDKYVGSGGSASPSIIKIQFEYDLKSGNILDLSLHSFIDQDATNAKETINDILENDLIVRDLGYIAIDLLRQTQKKGAYYLNRLHTGINVYEKKDAEFIKIDFGKLHKHMRKNNKIRIQKTVYIGEQKFETHIIIETLPTIEYEKRTRKNKKNKKQKNITDKYKAHNGLNMYVTNTEFEGEQVRLVYSLRWQIELMFKIWKSIGEIDEIKSMKTERFEVFLLAKLIWIVLNWQIMRLIVNYFYVIKKIAISPYKLYKTLKMYLLDFRTAIENKTKLLFLNKIIEMSPSNLKSERKKNSTNWSYEIITMLASKKNSL